MKRTRIILLFFILFLSRCGTEKQEDNRVKHDVTPQKEDAMPGASVLEDTVNILDTFSFCEVTGPDTLPYFADYKGYRYYFACGPCRDRFLRRPAKYLRRADKFKLKVIRRKL